MQLLALPPYCYPTLLGLAVSVGGLTESTVSTDMLHTCPSMYVVQVRHSSSALLHYLSSVSGSVGTLEPFAESVLKILQTHQQESRVGLPLLKTLDLLLSNGVFDVYSSLDE